MTKNTSTIETRQNKELEKIGTLHFKRSRKEGSHHIEMGGGGGYSKTGFKQREGKRGTDENYTCWKTSSSWSKSARGKGFQKSELKRTGGVERIGKFQQFDKIKIGGERGGQTKGEKKGNSTKQETRQKEKEKGQQGRGQKADCSGKKTNLRIFGGEEIRVFH